MSKSVFTIQTPERCEDCPCIGISAGCHVGYCKLAGKINSDYHVKIIPNWCPLMPLPEKMKLTGNYNGEHSKTGGKTLGYKVGWNACINEITGEVKQMERLTKISEAGYAYYPKCFEEPCYGMGECLDDKCSLISDVCKKLAEYEQLEEQGLLLRLPCKAGDTVWDIDTGRPEPYKITAFSYGCHDLLEFGCDDEITFYYTGCDRPIAGAFLLSEIGKTVFLTREEAVKKLEEMKK